MVKVQNFMVVLLVCAAQVECGDYVPDRKCATLFSAPNFGGNSFTLKDFDQSVDLTREYRQSLVGWPKTASIRVENGCKIRVCNGTYFEEHCDSFSNDTTQLQDTFWIVKSADCFCGRKCSCEDIYITHDENIFPTIGRAYLKGGCDTCNEEYVTLMTGKDQLDQDVVNNFLLSNVNSFEAFVLRNGCSLNIFPELYEYRGDQYSVIKGPIYKGWNETFGSFDAKCDTPEQIDPPSKFETYLPLYDIPVKLDTLQEMLLSNNTFAKHPGIQAALESVRNGKSSRNAYVVLIGIDLMEFNVFSQFANGRYFDSYIREYHIPVGVDDLRITTQLRVIVVPMIEYGFDEQSDDRTMRQLNDYLSEYEDLDGVVPTAVIVQHDLQSEKIDQDDVLLERMIGILSAMHHRLIAGNYSNVMFTMRRARNVDFFVRNPEPLIADLESVLVNKYRFPMPIAISMDLHPVYYESAHFVNGYVKMSNEEYWPKSVENSLVNICEKGRDPLGKAILQAAFQDNWTPHASIHPLQDISGQKHYVVAEPAYGEDCECSTIRVQLEQEIEALKAELDHMKMQISENTEQIREILS